MKKMKICFIMPNVFPVPATLGGATEMLITNFLKENEKQHLLDCTCVSIYEKNAADLSKEYKNTNFIYIKNDERKKEVDLTFNTVDDTFKSYMDKIYDKINDTIYDFIIVEGGDITGYEYLINKMPNQRFLVHIHGNVLGDNKINNKIYEYFIAISKYTKKLIMQDKKIKEEKIKLLYNGIVTQDFSKEVSNEEKLQLKKKYQINENDTVIMFFGRTIKEKGIKELITSFKALKNLNNAKLLIVGNSHYAQEIKTEYDYELEKISEDVKDKIKFTGYIQNRELYKIHAISDIVVLPSMWEELFGLVLVESMASGLPIITTRSGGIPEVVNEKCAYILEKDDNLIENMTEKMDYLIENKDIRIKMGQEGKKQAKKFDIEQYYKNFINMLEEIV